MASNLWESRKREIEERNILPIMHVSNGTSVDANPTLKLEIQSSNAVADEKTFSTEVSEN